MVESCNLGTDVGGTFTDLAWCTPSGELHCFKVPSTPSRPGQSILDRRRRTVRRAGAECRDLAGRAPHAQQHRRDQCADRASRCAHRPDHHCRLPRRVRVAASGDSASDAVRLAPAGTAGAARPGARGARAHRPGRRRTRTARRGRCGRGRARLAGRRAWRSPSSAFIHSYRNPAHEQQAREIVARARHRAAPGTVQRDLAAGARVRAQRADRAERVDPADRRGLSRSADRRVWPSAASRCRRASRVRTAARNSRATLRERPVVALLSGPAAGVAGAAATAEDADWTAADLMTLDVGGTSADIGVIRDGRPVLSSEEQVGEFPVLVPTVAVSSIGAGGGSIIWLDPHRVAEGRPAQCRRRSGTGLLRHRFAGPGADRCIPGCRTARRRASVSAASWRCRWHRRAPRWIRLARQIGMHAWRRSPTAPSASPPR